MSAVAINRYIVACGITLISLFILRTLSDGKSDRNLIDNQNLIEPALRDYACK